MGSAAGDTRGLHWSALPWAVRGSCLSTSLPTVEGGANYTQVGKLQVALFLYRTEPIPAKVPPSSVFLGQPFRHGRTSSLNKTLSACLFFFFFFSFCPWGLFGPWGQFSAGLSHGVTLPDRRLGFLSLVPTPQSLLPSDFNILFFLLLVLTMLIPRFSVAHSVPFSLSLPLHRPKFNPTPLSLFLSASLWPNQTNTAPLWTCDKLTAQPRVCVIHLHSQEGILFQT